MLTILEAAMLRTFVVWTSLLPIAGAIVLVIWNVDYQGALLAVFFFCFGVAHLLLAMGKLTGRTIKVMDFTYVTLTCVAAFIGFLGAQSTADRDPYLRLVTQIRLKEREFFLPMPANAAAVADYARKNAAFYCTEEFARSVYYSKPFCTWANGIADALGNAPDGPTLQALYAKSKREADLHFWNATAICQPSHPSRSFGGPTSGGPFFGQQQIDGLVTAPSIIDEASKALLCAQAQSSTHVLDALELMSERLNLGLPAAPAAAPVADAITLGGFSKALIWPFVLAVALALRLTKASADISGWASP